MRDLIEIRRRARELAERGERAVLATVVEVEGSAYRREGTRLLIEGDGRLTGVLSGGCLERDLVERARQLLTLDACRLECYDLRSPDEALWGLGLGCGGRITLLLQPLLPDAGERSPLAPFDRVALARRPAVVATVFRVHGEGGGRAVGDQLIDEPGLAPPGLGGRIHEVLAETRGGARPLVRRVALEGGELDLLCEPATPPTRLAIVGAGRDVVPVARLAGELGWEVTVADPRPTAGGAARFDGLATYVDGAARGLAAALALDAWSALLVMTHSYLDDLAALTELLNSPAPYIGLLGPAARRDRLLADLAMQGRAPRPAELARLHGPAGLELGGRAPEEVALAILAEIQKVFSQPARSEDVPPAPVAARRTAP